MMIGNINSTIKNRLNIAFCQRGLKTNVLSSSSAKKIWHNYWDSCITYENSYFTRLNYIWFNPVKHSYVEKAEEWEFGSYTERIKHEREYLKTVEKNYPFDRVKVIDDFYLFWNTSTTESKIPR